MGLEACFQNSKTPRLLTAAVGSFLQRLYSASCNFIPVFEMRERKSLKSLDNPARLFALSSFTKLFFYPHPYFGWLLSTRFTQQIADGFERCDMVANDLDDSE